MGPTILEFFYFFFFFFTSLDVTVNHTGCHDYLTFDGRLFPAAGRRHDIRGPRSKKKKKKAPIEDVTQHTQRRYRYILIIQPYYKMARPSFCAYISFEILQPTDRGRDSRRSFSFLSLFLLITKHTLTFTYAVCRFFFFTFFVCVGTSHTKINDSAKCQFRD